MRLSKNIKTFLPFLEWLPELKNKKVLKADIIAWLTVSIILIPQAMAYAQLAWLPARIGLYTAFLPVMIWAIFSSSRQLSTWPVTVVSLMTATTLAPLFLDKDILWLEYIMYASILAIMMWVMQLVLWFFKFWSIFNFLSHSVIVWFVNAAALIIWITQLKKIFWVQIPETEHFYETIIALYQNIINHTHLETFIFWGSTIIILYLLKRFFPKIPSFLIVVIASIIISNIIWFENMWWKVVWEIKWWLPNFYIPKINFDIISKLFTWAIIIGILWFTEAISIAKAIWLETKKTVSTNSMLISEWLANLSSGFTNWYPVSGTFSRSAVNLKAWAKTPFASIITGIIVWIVLLFFTKYLEQLPEAVLSAIIIVAVIWLIKRWPIIKSWKIQKTDAIVSIITFLSTLFFAPHLEKWIFIWIFLSLLFYIKQSMKPRFVKLSRSKDWIFRDAKLHWLKTSRNIAVYRFYWKLFFVNIRYFEEKIMEEIKQEKDIKILIFDFELIPYLDSSAIEVLEWIIHSLKKFKIEIYFTWLRSKVLMQFKKANFTRKIWTKHIFPNVLFAIKYIQKTKEDLNIWPLIRYSPIRKKRKKILKI